MTSTGDSKKGIFCVIQKKTTKNRQFIHQNPNSRFLTFLFRIHGKASTATHEYAWEITTNQCEREKKEFLLKFGVNIPSSTGNDQHR